MINTFFAADTHFSHARILELCNRPFADIDEMDNALVENWNHVVGEDDVVFHLGDVALGPFERWDNILSSLNGHKVLVVGNHERIFGQNSQKYIDRFMPAYRRWFEDIYDNASIILSNQEIVNLSHFPYDGDSHDSDRYREYRLEDNGTPLIHGHTHLDGVISYSSLGTKQIHVGMDAHNYTPVSEQQLIDYLRIADDLEASYGEFKQ